MTGVDVGINIHSSRFSTDSVLIDGGRAAEEDSAPAVDVSLRLSAVGISAARIWFKMKEHQYIVQKPKYHSRVLHPYPYLSRPIGFHHPRRPQC